MTPMVTGLKEEHGLTDAQAEALSTLHSALHIAAVEGALRRLVPATEGGHATGTPSTRTCTVRSCHRDHSEEYFAAEDAIRLAAAALEVRPQ